MRRLILFLIFGGIFLAAQAVERQNVVYKVDIKDEIGPEVWRLVRKSFDRAEEENAKYILIHMNTYGGMVVYADSLRSLILNSKKPVWVFIDNNAASAGALIAIACDRIYMREGANIGAATVVNQSGKAMPDKYQSYMRSMIRATAQAQGRDTIVRGRDTVYRWKRDPHIAEAMVDESIYIKGVSDSGKIVTFTPAEAMQHGFCDGIAGSVEDVLAREQVSDYVIESYTPSAMDRVIGFLINPIVQGLLIMLIVGGIYFELQTPGIGFPLIAALTGCLLYFAPLYLEGLAGYWEIIVFIIGVVLLLLEIFVIPGFGITGISGIILIVTALVFAGIDRVSFEFAGDFVQALVRSLFLVVSSAVIALFLSMWLGAKFLGSKRWAFALHAEQRPEEGYVGVDMQGRQEIGKTGCTVTDLRPAGKVEIGTELFDAVSLLGDYIEKGSEVVVKKYQSGQLYVVRRKEEK
ncbi:MAG: nodulation protein NfeD [Odoribacter splanchnicus]|nr:nodulation protein NfeD [Odoribacter splanchnicus]